MPDRPHHEAVGIFAAVGEPAVDESLVGGGQAAVVLSQPSEKLDAAGGIGGDAGDLPARHWLLLRD